MEIFQFMQGWQKSSYAIIIDTVLFIFFILFLRSILVKLAKRLVLKKDLEGSDLFPFIRSLLNWASFYGLLFFVILYFSEEYWLIEEQFKIGTTSITFLSIIVAVIIITLGFRISQFFARFVLQPTLQKYDLDLGLQYTLTRISHYIIVILAVVISIMNIGLDLSALTIFASVLGVGIGFGLQNIAANFISGVILLFERPIKVGDIVKLEEMVCVVEEIKMRATVVRTVDNERIIIPNSEFVENQIVNWSHTEEKMRIVINIGVAYGTDVRLMERLLLQAATEQEDVMTDPAPRVDFLEFADSSLDFNLIVWVPSPSLRTVVRSAINFRINDLFIENGIEIPYPQQDLHIRSIDPKVIEAMMKKEN